MKKIIFLALLIIIKATATQAQITTKPVKNVQKTTSVESKAIPPPPPPAPATVQKTTIPPPPPPPPNTNNNQNASVYSLTSARVNIRTGADNKEFPSTVVVWLMSLGGGFALEQPAENLKNEMKSNSNFEFGLQNNPKNDPKNKTLEAFQKEGFGLRVRYFANWPTDAWKIEGISITLEFRDQNGNLHPVYGNKTITFNNANGFLNYWTRDIYCKADGYFNPLTASIQE